jgi:hypothetical protein
MHPQRSRGKQPNPLILEDQIRSLSLSLSLSFLLYRYLLNDPHAAKPPCHDLPCGETIMSMTPHAAKQAE